MRLDWASLLDVLRGCERVVLTSHVRPDCDALGSELGMAGILEAIGKHVRIVNAQATPANLRWIDPRGKIESLAEKVRPADLADRDLFIVLDTSAWAQLGAMGEVAKSMRDRVL
ncbi:MAG: bifunctional oligoribonuclease/PAP phosphatase NrnA, partial [Planctomycetia bacterium]|nr:bifunctional oligoribonuclease/PAP phosphatase NrnA [Planctomycetia bacterium]